MTKIEWTDRTWNPTVGCSRVSPGCDNCYAMGQARRFDGTVPAYEGTTLAGPVDWSGKVNVAHDRLTQPLTWRKPSRVFVNSMSDLFHPAIPEEALARIWLTMVEAHRTRGHVFQVLTKRPQRIRSALGPAGIMWYDHMFNDPEPGIWLGTSIESDRYTFRADYLRDAPAAVRFLSLEPLLGPLPSLDLTGIDWVIVGGESGPRARPLEPDNVRDIRDRCQDQGIPFFFKQWGTWLPYTEDTAPFYRAQTEHPEHVDGHHLPTDLSEHDPVSGWWWPDPTYGTIYRRVGKDRAGRWLDGRTWDQTPQEPSP